MRILLSNDDGHRSTGIRVLRETLSTNHAVTVVAPEVEQSAKSHAFSMHEPIRIHELSEGYFSVHGTPADCVYIGVHELCKERPEIVVSGINRGGNLGEDVHYSGTVAAAKEGAMQGIPGLAVSLVLDRTPPGAHRHYKTAARVALGIVRRIAQGGMPERTLLNLNVPNLPFEELKGLRVTHLGSRRYASLVDRRQDPRGRSYVWIGGPPLRHDKAKDGDVGLIEQGFAVLTPLRIDITDYEGVARLQHWEDELV